MFHSPEWSFHLPPSNASHCPLNQSHSSSRLRAHTSARPSTLPCLLSLLAPLPAPQIPPALPLLGAYVPYSLCKECFSSLFCLRSCPCLTLQSKMSPPPYSSSTLIFPFQQPYGIKYFCACVFRVSLQCRKAGTLSVCSTWLPQHLAQSLACSRPFNKKIQLMKNSSFPPSLLLI